EEVNNGLSLIHFHGHSSPGVSDINIGYVTNPSLNYRNKGKYPIIILNGCESGNIFIERDVIFGVTFGENWVISPERGAINFLGHSNFGFDLTLRSYSESIYNQWFADSSQTHWSIGKILQKVNRVYIQNFATASDLNIAQATQFVLQGDPSVKLFPNPFPDYRINPNRVQIEPYEGRIITTLSDSFLVKVQIENTGIYPRNQEVEILIRRILPNGETIVYPLNIVQDINLIKNFEFNIPLADLDFKSVGENTLEVIIDPENKFQELNKTNNRVSVKFFIYPSGLTCLFPEEFTIQSSNVVNFVIQSSDLLKQNTEYLIEIDTTIKFNSPLKKSNRVFGTSLAQWNDVDLKSVFPNLVDSTVIYWRASFNDQSSSNSLFSQSSFVFIESSPKGWAQHHFNQFDKNTTNNLLRDQSTRMSSFETQKMELEISIGKDQVSTNHIYKILTNNEVLIENPCGYNDQGFDFGDNGLYMVGIRKSDLSLVAVTPLEKAGLLQANGFGGGAIFCSSIANAVFRFFPESFNYWYEEGFTYYPSNDDMVDFLNRFFGNMSDGDYVLFFSTGRPRVQNWDPRIVDILQQNTKSEFLTQLGNKAQMIYFGQKNVGPIRELMTDTLNLDQEYTSLYLKELIEIGEGNGKMVSTIIGPSENWDKLFRKITLFDQAGEDWNIKISGIDLDNKETILVNNLKSNSFSLENIDAQDYPYLRLTANFTDELNFIPSQLESWIVTYQNNTPEGVLVLDDSRGTYTNIPSIQEGAIYTLPFTFRNISNHTFKSPLVVEYNIRNATSGENRVLRDTIYQSLSPNSQIIITPRIATLGLIGDNSFQIFVNPRHQVETNFLNNLWTTRFSVFKDKENPIIGLTIDGRRIKNGEIVSPSPLIELYIKDENPFKRKVDTSSVRFLLKKNCITCDFDIISMKNNDFNITYTNSNNSVTTISVNPKNLEDGVYTLCVEGSDATENMAGTRPYCIEFTVVSSPGVSFFVPVPNPFREQVKFAYQLNGKDIPDELNIYIFNSTGQLVRKLEKSELGNPRIGNNLTNAWDGRDQRGNQLPSGIYYYKPEVKLNGQIIQQMPSDTDSKVVNGYGKIIILR
ncbi:MAG: C25 family cysteine peptidase, partial [Cytophagales bacterium]